MHITIKPMPLSPLAKIVLEGFKFDSSSHPLLVCTELLPFTELTGKRRIVCAHE
jgi:hypothetical protein